jgi:hypothetical protein
VNVRDLAFTPSPATDREDPWHVRLESDAQSIASGIGGHLRQLHEAVVKRAIDSQANSLLVSGSTARRSRTAISDLDYHLIGQPVDTRDLSRELDVHVLSAAELESRVLAGDDFVQWSLRFGWVVFDDGAVRAGITLISQRDLWPDVARKRDHATKSLELARRFVASGDLDAALAQVRTALSLAARTYLLAFNVFPLSRAELPGQLRATGRTDVAAALESSIYGTPSLDDLNVAVRLGEALISDVTRDGRIRSFGSGEFQGSAH